MTQITGLLRDALVYARGRLSRGVPEEKQSAVGGVISLHTQGRPVWTSRNYSALAKEGFSENAIGYRSLEKIASVGLGHVEKTKAKLPFRRRFIGWGIM